MFRQLWTQQWRSAGKTPSFIISSHRTRKLCISTASREKPRHGLFQRFSSMVQKLGCWANAWSDEKLMEFYHSKRIDTVKLGCALSNLANISLHSSTIVKFYPFLEGDEDLLQKIGKDMVGGPSIALTRRTVVEETRIRSSSNTCTWIVGIDANQLYPHAMCQSMPTGLYTCWEFNVDLQRFKIRSNRTRSLENIVMAFFKNSRPECIFESF